MTRLLHAWEGDRLVGVFERHADESVSFRYSDGCVAPISLSMPLDRPWKPDAPFRFLDGLLPDDKNERYVMMNSLKAASVDPFDLLESVDATGGLSFTEGDEPPERRPSVMRILSEADLEAEIARVAGRRVTGWETEPEAKFSLAGTQGKFTLVRYGGRWFRPDINLASTHIVKPDMRGLPGSARVEDATMTLAGLCGVAVPPHGIMTAGKKEAYIVERFDRAIQPDGFARRIRTEDMTQALALTSDEKYDVECADVIGVLRKEGGDDELAYQWLRQVAFNAFAGNCDAHGKNYSVVLGDGGISLSPVYDSVNTLMWGAFDSGLAMWVNGKCFAWELSKADWKAEADAAGLDGFRVADEAAAVSESILDNARRAAADLPPELSGPFLGSIEKANKGMTTGPRVSADEAIRAADASERRMETSRPSIAR